MSPANTQPVPVAGVESRLRELWDELNSNRQTLRACMSNLVVLCPDGQCAANAAEAIAPLAGRHPCRVLLLEGGGEGDAVEALVSAHCSTEGARQVCCEQITLRGGDVRALGHAALPLLIPDLPVVLWAMAASAPPADALGELMPQVDRVIVDTRRTATPAAAWSVCHRAPGGHSLHCAVSDLSWSRLGRLREAVALLFDESPEAVATVRDVEVAWSPPDAAPAAGRASALLIIGWLADRIGWSLAGINRRGEHGCAIALTDEAGRRIEARCIPAEGDDRPPPRRIARVALTADTRYAVRRIGDSPIYHLSANDRERTLAREPRGTGDLLLDELQSGGADAGFQAALAVALPAAVELEPST
jgi:glucose-6-phosphate dehydrogenase assembly protein OpcA